ncbi:MAG: TrkH family potassium uptake protein [Thermoplasmatota archaeon]
MKNAQIILRDTGLVLLIVGIAALAAVVPALVYGEYSHGIWILATSLLFFLTGGLVRLMGGREDGEPKLKHGMAIAALSWLLVSLISTVPFMQITGFDFLSAFFEAMSGWSTTGLTMVAVEESLSHTIQFWRSYMQWMGGVGVVVLTLIVLSRPGTGSFTLYRSEAREEKIHPSVVSTVKSIWWIFLLYTGLGILLYVLAGMPLWGAVNHCMTAISTGGFSVHNASIGYYDSLAIELATIVIVVLGATSYVAHHDLLRGRIRKFLADTQFRTLLLLMVVGSVALTLFVVHDCGDLDFAVRHSVFQFISAQTTTGFQSVDLAGWDVSAKLILSLSMVIGGAAGATTGGIKLIRGNLLFKRIVWGVRDIFLPEGGHAPRKVGGTLLTRDEAERETSEASMMLMLWILMLLAGVFVLLNTVGGSLEDVFFEVASAQGNVGLSTGITSMGMDPIAKVMLIINMWTGRLEIIPILVLLRSLLSRRSIF